MSIAEQMLTLKKDFDDVFIAGRKAGGIVECDIDHDALYNNGYTEGHTKGYNDGHQKGYTEGETAGYNKGLADGQGGSGCTVDHNALRQEGYEDGFTDGQESVPDMLEHALCVELPSLNIFGKPTVELNLSERLSSLQAFISTKIESDKNITVEHLTINSLGLPTSMSGFMQCNVKARDEKLKTLTLNFSTENIISYNNAFNGLMALEEINGIPLDCSSATVIATFTYCNSLKEVRFKDNTIEKSIIFSQSPNLSADSIQSIIDGLATVTTAQTITFHSSIVLTDEQKATIQGKGWTLAQ